MVLATQCPVSLLHGSPRRAEGSRVSRPNPVWRQTWSEASARKIALRWSSRQDACVESCGRPSDMSVSWAGRKQRCPETLGKLTKRLALCHGLG